MKDKTNWLLGFYIYACREFCTIKGLIVSLIIPCILFSAIASFFRNFEDLKGSRLSFLLTAHFYLTLWFVISLLIIIIWFVKRNIPKIKKGKIGVLFGPSHANEIRTELEDISKKLRKEIEGKDFTKIISIKTLPPNIEVGEHSKNLDVLTKANAAVLICGNFETFTAEGKHITGFSSFTISARTLPTSPQYAPILLGDAIVGRQLGWTSENTIHKNVVVNNLSEIARYIVGLSLIANTKYDNAQTILGPLLVEVNHKYNQKRLPIEIIRFKNTIQNAYVISLINQVSREYRKTLVDETIFRVNIGILQGWKHTLDEAFRIDNKKFDALLLMAIVGFLLKDVEDAKNSIRKARQLVPFQNQNLCDLSEAFLICYEGNLREARKIYRKLTKNPPSSQTMTDIFCFLHQAIETFVDKPQIRFVYALLNDEYGDKSIASDEFKIFISETDGIDIYKQWNREAKLRLKRIEQSDETVSMEVDS